MAPAARPPHSARSADWIAELESVIRGRLRGRLQDFLLLVDDLGVVLHGTTTTYHVKQLAQHAVMTQTSLPILANEIVVV